MDGGGDSSSDSDEETDTEDDSEEMNNDDPNDPSFEPDNEANHVRDDDLHAGADLVFDLSLRHFENYSLTNQLT